MTGSHDGEAPPAAANQRPPLLPGAFKIVARELKPADGSRDSRTRARQSQGVCAPGHASGAPPSRKPARRLRLARGRPPARAHLAGLSAPNMRVCRSSKSTSRESAPVPGPSRFQEIRFDDRRRGLRPREPRRRRPLKRPIATGQPLSYAWVHPTAQQIFLPFRIAPDECKSRECIWAAATWTATTSQKQASEITQTKRRPRTDQANAIDSRKRRQLRLGIHRACARSAVRHARLRLASRLGTFRSYRVGSFRGWMTVGEREILATPSALRE